MPALPLSCHLAPPFEAVDVPTSAPAKPPDQEKLHGALHSTLHMGGGGWTPESVPSHRSIPVVQLESAGSGTRTISVGGRRGAHAPSHPAVPSPVPSRWPHPTPASDQELEETLVGPLGTQTPSSICMAGAGGGQKLQAKELRLYQLPAKSWLRPLPCCAVGSAGGFCAHQPI